MNKNPMDPTKKANDEIQLSAQDVFWLGLIILFVIGFIVATILILSMHK